jgi:hypothetical protein
MLSYVGSNESPLRAGYDPSNSLYLSLGEWPRLPFTARIERAQFHRARSASKKGTSPLPPLLAGFFSILLAARFNRKARSKPGIHATGDIVDMTAVNRPTGLTLTSMMGTA